MYTQGVPGRPGAGGQGKASQPMGKRFPGKRRSQNVFALSALALRDTKVIRYKRGGRSELFNGTKIIVNKTVDVSPAASSPS